MHRLAKSEQLPALRNIRDNLKPKGQLAIILAPSKEGLPFQKALDKLKKRQPYAKNMKGFRQTQTFFKADEYWRLLQRAVFFIESIGYNYNTKSYQNSDELRLWLQQWLPYSKHLASKSTELRNRFLQELVQAFLKE